MKRTLLIVGTLLLTCPLKAADPAPSKSTNTRVELSQQHAYQKQLRSFLATLKDEDFRPEYKDLTVAPVEGDSDAKLRLWIQALQPPSVGRKRNFSSVMIKPELFTLASIEGPESVMRPPAHPEPLVDLANWNYPGNTYYDSRPLRLRAFVLAAVDMIMADRLIDSADETERLNLDRLSGAISRFAYVYPGIRDVVPKDVRDAYLTGLKRYVVHLLAHQPKDFPVTPPGIYTRVAPALGLAAKALGDPGITARCDAYAAQIFSDERFFRPAGYFPHGGTYDSFNGMSHYYAIFAAIATEWPLAKQAIERSYRLRAHMTLPEPDGALVGPSHMAALTSADAPLEQWDSRMRAWAAALVTDEAASLTKMPDSAEIEKGAAAAAGEVNAQLHELSWAKGGLDPFPWKFQPPGMLINYAYQNYPAGYYARRTALEAKGEMTKLPVLRSENFVRQFGNEFTSVKTSSYAAIVHTGPISDPTVPDSALGFGGGALSAFWTPNTGCVILGRGIGSWNPRHKTMYEEWRSWPTHAVTGITAAGKVFTSAHIVKPDATTETKGDVTTVTARGHLPRTRFGEGELLAGTFEYSRTFELASRGLHITTTLNGDGQDVIAELYETLPVFLREAGTQPKATPALIELQVGGNWISATGDYSSQVTAARLTRFGKSVQIKFDSPCRVKLAPTDFTDKYMTRAACHNLLVDLLGSDQPATVKGIRTVSYWIESAVE